MVENERLMIDLLQGALDCLNTLVAQGEAAAVARQPLSRQKTVPRMVTPGLPAVKTADGSSNG